MSGRNWSSRVPAHRGGVGVLTGHGGPKVEFRVLVGCGRLECRGEVRVPAGGAARLAERKNGLAVVKKGWVGRRHERIEESGGSRKRRNR